MAIGSFTPLEDGVPDTRFGYGAVKVVGYRMTCLVRVAAFRCELLRQTIEVAEGRLGLVASSLTAKATPGEFALPQV